MLFAGTAYSNESFRAGRAQDCDERYQTAASMARNKHAACARSRFARMERCDGLLQTDLAKAESARKACQKGCSANQAARKFETQQEGLRRETT
ncbi:MAG: hypothetical protein JNL98_40685 [Bryobacterales bacterium]|nr:hypothetical protein [Bryobacterales bacterium]